MRTACCPAPSGLGGIKSDRPHEVSAAQLLCQGGDLSTPTAIIAQCTPKPMPEKLKVAMKFPDLILIPSPKEMKTSWQKKRSKKKKPNNTTKQSEIVPSSFNLWVCTYTTPKRGQHRLPLHRWDVKSSESLISDEFMFTVPLNWGKWVFPLALEQQDRSLSGCYATAACTRLITRLTAPQNKAWVMKLSHALGNAFDGSARVFLAPVWQSQQPLDVPSSHRRLRSWMEGTPNG